MPGRRSAIPARVQRQLLQEVSCRCPVCDETDVATLQFHHIEPYAQTQRHDPATMIALCANCHALAGAGEISPEQLFELKRGATIIKFPRAEASIVQNVTGEGNMVVAGNATIHVPRRSRRSAVPRIAGTVCDDPRKVGYLQHLAKRYNHLKRWHVNQTGGTMRYGAIHASYARDMKYPIRTTPLVLFDQAVRYLQRRILATVVGRQIQAAGRRVFRSFEEFDGQDDLS